MILTANILLKNIQKEIAQFDFGQSPKSLYEPIDYIMQLGGKRMRPLLVLYAYSLFKSDVETIIKPSLLVEIFHNFTLMHDDIMDNAPLRRNKPTVHEKWDSNTAILSGDVMLVKTYQLLENIDKKQFHKIFAAFNKCAAGVCEGQQLDMDYSRCSKISMEQYIGMIKLKTAILLGFSLEMGSILADASEKDVALLKLFGEEIGIAFQIADDLLDAYGDADKFGKKVGGDIIENKKTFLSITAFEKASKLQLQQLTKLYSSTSQIDDTAKIKAVLEIFNQLNIQEQTQQEIRNYTESAFVHLAKVKGDILRKGILKKYINSLIVREV